MSETDFPREPLMLVEVRTPKCANSYGCGQCHAGLGLVDTSDLSQLFLEGAGDYTATGATLVQQPSALRMTATASGAVLSSGAVTTGFSGTDYKFVVVHGRAVTPAATPVFSLEYGSGGAGSTMTAQNLATEFRGVTLNGLSAGESFVAVFDADDSADYATDWDGQTVDEFDLRFYAEAGAVVDIYSIQVCSLSLFDTRGKECYNTRATCTSVADYDAFPCDSWTPDQTYLQGETVPSDAVNRSLSVVGVFKVFIPVEPVGVIWEQGDDTTGLYLGFTGDFLVFRAFDGSVSDGASVAKIQVPVADVAGSTLTLYAEVDWGNKAVTLFSYDQTTLKTTLLGRDAITGSPTADWASSATGKIGGVEGTTVVGESTADYNGVIDLADLYQGATGLLFPREEFDTAPDSETYRLRTILSEGIGAKPADEVYLIPALEDVGTISTRLNLSGADEDYEPIGRRATLDVTSPDFIHSGFYQDPYVTDRANPEVPFWLTWQARQKYGKTAASVFLYEGYAGQFMADMKTRRYVLERFNWQQDTAALYCRDALSATEFRRVQIPALSTGKLGADVAIDATEFILTGDLTDEYPATGTIRIDREIIQYSSRAVVGTDTVFSGLTRGSDGSNVSTHEVDDLAQLCLRLTDARIDDVLRDWVVNRARVPAQLVNLAAFTSEYDEHLTAYKLNALLVNPEDANKLIGQMAQECGFFFWWDDRGQQIDLKAIRALAVDEIEVTWTDRANIVANSLSKEEMPEQRLTSVSIYYNPVDVTGDLQSSANYRNGLLVENGTASSPEQYGGQLQNKEIYSRFLTTQAAVNQTGSRTSFRYADVPVELQLHVDAKDRELWIGDYVKVQTRAFLDAFGNEGVKRYLIIEAEEIVSGDLVRYVLTDITLGGLIYVITANDTPSYTAELFAEGLAFITDNDGLNPDGSLGATIS